jgi:DNA-binding transcriptional regulator YdaS (Cro superfamily)
MGGGALPHSFFFFFFEIKSLSMKLSELKSTYDLTNIDLAKAIMREPSYVSKLLSHKIQPSLMMALVINQVTKGLVTPAELVRREDFVEYFRKRQEAFSAEYPHWFLGGRVNSG